MKNDVIVMWGLIWVQDQDYDVIVISSCDVIMSTLETTIDINTHS